MRLICPVWEKGWCTGCSRASPACACREHCWTPERREGDAPARAEAASKILHTPWAAGGLDSPDVAISVLQGVWCPQKLATFHSPWLTLMRAMGQRVLPAPEGVGNLAAPNLAHGCPMEKMLVTHCWKQWLGAVLKMPRAFLVPSTGSLPPVSATEEGIFSLFFLKASKAYNFIWNCFSKPFVSTPATTLSDIISVLTN